MQTAEERNIFLSTLPATKRDRMRALVVVSVSTVLFVLAAVYARVPLIPVPAFIASYQSALAINDLITAMLLFSQSGDQLDVDEAEDDRKPSGRHTGRRNGPSDRK